MAQIYSKAEGPRRDFLVILQLTNWILDSGVTCHITPDNSYFIPVSLVETDKYTEVVDGNFSASKQTVEVQIKCVTIVANP